MKIIIILRVLALFILIGGIFNSCSKPPEPPENIPNSIELKTEKKQYSPYELVTVTTKGITFNSNSIVGKINGSDILIQSADTLAYFLMPDLPNGSYKASFSTNGKDYNFPIIVTALTNVLSPESYLNEMEKSLKQDIEALNYKIAELERNDSTEGYRDLKKDILQYTKIFEDFKLQFSNLSSEEKVNFAKFMASNKSTLDEYDELIASMNVKLPKTEGIQGDIDDYEANVTNASAQLTKNVIWTSSKIPKIIALAGLFILGDAYIKIGVGVVLTLYLMKVSRTATSGAELIDKAIKPFENIFATQTETFHKSGEAIGVNISAKYRSLIYDDENGEGIISNIADNYNNLKTAFNDMRNKLPSILRPSYFIKALKNTYISKNRPIHNKYIKINNISNPNVILEQLNQPDGSIKIKATTSAATDQNFTYDIEYSNSNYTNNFKSTINGTVVVENLYGLQIGNYRPVYEEITVVETLKHGDAFTTPNYVTRMVRITYEGRPLSSWRMLTFGTYPKSAEDIVDSSYQIKVGNGATLSIIITLKNDAYKSIVGKTLTVDCQYDNNSISIKKYVFTADGLSIDGGPVGSIAFVSELSPHYQPCDNSFVIDKDIVGAVYLNSKDICTPNYIMINSDGTFTPNSIYACPTAYPQMKIY